MNRSSLPLQVMIAVAMSALANVALAEDVQKPDAPAIPTLRCEMKTLTACSPDGACKANEKVEGMKLPLKLTIDFENSVVAAVDDTGYARTDKMDGVVKTQDQLMLHGVDGEFGWQLLVSDKSEVASLVMSTADVALAAFGGCTNK
jgi:hypothetical protein